MTSTVSFKEKLKHAFSLFKWDLKACTGTLTVFGILAAVFTTIILTLCLVLGSSLADIIFQTYTFNDLSRSDVFGGSIQVFQLFSVYILYFMTTIFTIFYTIKVFSYLHNKRKADLYGSLPISRTTLYLTKAASAYIFSIVPTLFFMGIISVISICCGQPLLSEVTQVYIKIIMGAFACISAYGLISICCGTTFNAVIMFIVVCIAYPLSAMFVKGVIGGFFVGSYFEISSNHFIMNALNPLASYDGINVIYWIIFSVVCLAASALLIKKRRAERAQSSFAFYLPCHIIKVLVAFLAGMFLGVLFGSINTFDNAFWGFVFGFILGSIPAFIITHLIFYKGFTKLIKTSVSLGGLIVVVVAGMALCNYDVFGYNNFVPDPSEVESAGFYHQELTYLNSSDSFKKIVRNMADDFSDNTTKTQIIDLHTKRINKLALDSQDKFIGVWANMATTAMDMFGIDEPQEAYSYRMKNGTVINRVYTYTNSYDYEYSFDNESQCIDITTKKKYVEKYSALSSADKENFVDFSTLGYSKDNRAVYNTIISNQYYYDTDMISSYYSEDNNSKISKEQYDACEEIRAAIIKDLKKCSDEEYEKFISCQKGSSFYGSFVDYDYELPDLSSAQAMYGDIVCEIDIGAKSTYNSFVSSTASRSLLSSVYSYAHPTKYESYMIPKSFTNTIRTLQKLDILKNDMTINEDCKYTESGYRFY